MIRTLKKFDKTILHVLMQTVGVAISIWAIVTMSTWQLLLGSIIMFYLYNFVGYVITYHRILTHRVGKMHPIVEFICTGFAFFSTFVTPVVYVATHTNHHKYMDTEKDPHSPKHLGWKTLSAIFWVRGGATKAIIRMKKNKIANFYDKHSFVLMFLPLLLLFWPKVFLFFWLIPSVITLWVQYMTTWGHNADGPQKMGLLYGIISCGEHHHKWHHDHPNDTSGEGLVHYFVKALTYRT